MPINIVDFILKTPSDIVPRITTEISTNGIRINVECADFHYETVSRQAFWSDAGGPPDGRGRLMPCAQQDLAAANDADRSLRQTRAIEHFLYLTI